MEDHISQPYSTSEILGIGVPNTQMFACFASLILELDNKTTVFLSIDLAGL